MTAAILWTALIAWFLFFTYALIEVLRAWSAPEAVAERPDRH